MKLSILTAIFTLFCTFNLMAFDDVEYDELLDKHLASGHLTDAEVDEQKFQLINSKKYQNEFSRKVRGVASKMNEAKNILYLVNPEIEIPAK